MENELCPRILSHRFQSHRNQKITIAAGMAGASSSSSFDIGKWMFLCNDRLLKPTNRFRSYSVGYLI